MCHVLFLYTVFRIATMVPQKKRHFDDSDTKPHYKERNFILFLAYGFQNSVCCWQHSQHEMSDKTNKKYDKLAKIKVEKYLNIISFILAGKSFA